jgi:hypothetical protein
VHDHGAEAGVAQEHDVLGERLRSLSSTMALPPYFTTIVLPW